MVSIIVPVYNTREFLPKCVESILGQSLSDLELILVDDGSSDGSSEICDSYAAEDDRVVVIHKENGGSTSARNAGISVAHGEYIGFADSDDWIESSMYKTLLSMCQEHGADIAASLKFFDHAKSQYKDTLPIPAGIYDTQDHSMDILLRNLIYTEDYSRRGISPNLYDKLFDRHLLYEHQSQVDPRIRYGEDDVCVYSCLVHANRVAVTDHAYYHYRIREGSICHSTDEQYFAGITLFYQQLKSVFVKHPSADVLMKQLNRYMLEFVLRGVNRTFGFGYGVVVPFFLLPYTLLRDNGLKRIVLYGAGQVGQDYYQALRSTNLVEIAAWVDLQWDDYQKKGFPTQPIAVINEINYDGILIAIDNFNLAEKIKKSLCAMGVPEKDIFYEQPQKMIQTLREEL